MTRPTPRDPKARRATAKTAASPSANRAAAGRMVRGFAVLIAFIALCAVAWWLSRPEPRRLKPAEAPPLPIARSAPTVDPPSMPFTDVTTKAGIAFTHENGAAGEKLLPETMGGGVGVLDYDVDGDMDLLFVNSQRWPWDARPEAKPATCALYANDGTGRFTDVSRETGLDVGLYGMGCAIGDYDNDGDPDVYLSSVGRNRLLRNDAGRFTDATEQAGLSGPTDAWGTSCGWFDYDGDGRLDLMVCNYIVWSRELDLTQNFRFADGRRAYGRPQNFVGAHPLLFRNKGDGEFEDVSSSAGIRLEASDAGLPLAKSLGLTFADFDLDGDLDVVVANDTVRNLLFENKAEEGGAGPAFEEVGAAAGIAFDDDGLARGAMGVDCARFRDDGSFGVAIGNFSNEMTALYVTRAGEMSFKDEAVASGIGPRTRLELTFGLLFNDFDLDGRPDLFAANGHLEDEINRVQPNQRYEQSPHLFWNSGPGRASEFHALTEMELGKDILKPTVGRGAVYADFDGDGDRDIVMTAAGRPARLLRNDLPHDRRWVRLKLVGSKSNRDAIGASVTAVTGGDSQTETVMPTRSYLSQVEPVLTFGFGTKEPSKPIDEIKIAWPSGRETVLKNVEPAKLHVITES